MDMVTCGEEDVEADQNEEEEAEEGHMYRVNENLGDAKVQQVFEIPYKSHFLTCQVGVIIIIIILLFFRPYFQPLAKNLCTCIPLSEESQRSYEAQRQVCHWHSDLDESMMREGCIMSFVWKSSTKGMAARTDQTVMSKCNELLCSFKRLACVLWTLFLNLKTVPVETQKSGVWGCFIPR